MQDARTTVDQRLTQDLRDATGFDDLTVTVQDNGSASNADQVGFPMIGGMIYFGDDRDRFTIIGMPGKGSNVIELGLSAVVFFSTEPGNVAEDGATPGEGSPFAKVFAREIKRRQSLDEAFRRTAVEVNSATDDRQSPWRQGDLPFDVFIAGMRSLPIP